MKARYIYSNAAAASCGKKYVHKGWRGFERDTWHTLEASLGELDVACVAAQSKTRLQNAVTNVRRRLEVNVFNKSAGTNFVNVTSSRFSSIIYLEANL